MTTIPKTKKLLKEETIEDRDKQLFTTITVNSNPQEWVITPIECCNEFIAVARFKIDDMIIATPNAVYREQGVVIGFGPGLPTSEDRCPSQFDIGDVVAFMNKNIITTVDHVKYDNDQVVILSERSILYKLGKVPFKLG